MKKQQQQCGGGCLGAPMRALSRACDSACDLYVRGMSGCARRVPSGAAGAVGRGGYGRSASASSMFVHVSSDRVEDLVRAAAKQGKRDDATTGKKGAAAARQSRRVAPAEAADATAGKKGGAGALLVSAAPGCGKVHERKAGAVAAAAMETIAEDAPCEFGEDGACVLPPPSRRRRAVGGGLATRSGGFGAVKAGSEVLAR